MFKALKIMVVGASLLAVSWPARHSVGSAITDTSLLENLVAVTEDRATSPGVPGCDSISVFDTVSGTALYRGDVYVSPGRLAASADFNTFAAVFSNGLYGKNDGSPGRPFVVSANRDPSQLSLWRTSLVFGDDYARLGAIAITPDSNWVLAALEPYQVGGSRPNVGFGLGRFPFDPNGLRSGRLGPTAKELPLDGAPVDIFVRSDSHQAVVVTDARTINIVDIEKMKLINGPVEIPPMVQAPGSRNHDRGIQRSAISNDQRYVFANRFKASEIAAVDLVDKRSLIVSTGPTILQTGGLAVNGGWINPGLLAVHGHNTVAVFQFDPITGLTLLGQTAIKPPMAYDVDDTYLYGPQDSIAWSGSGAQIIAATSDGRAEFVVIDVTDGGRTLTPVRTLTACQDGVNYPNDIVTLNGVLTPPVTPTTPPTETPTATNTSISTPTAASTDTPTPTPSPSATPLPTSTPTPSATATRSPIPVYLPLLLHESCTPTQRHIDAALVLDASSSMLELTAAGRSKLAAAIAAAHAFLDALRLDAGDQAAVVTFNADAVLRSPLTADRAALDAALTGITTAQFTRLDLGVATARDELVGPRHRAGNTPVMVVLTDGRANPVPADVAVAEAQRAKDAGVLLFTVGLGADLDEAALVAMASQPAYYRNAPDAEQLAAIYRGIAGTIPCAPGVDWGHR